MNNIIRLQLLLLSCIISPLIARHIISQQVTRGRFGDQVLTVAKALCLAHINNIPFAYKPFPKSEQLQLSQYEQKMRGINNFNCITILPTTDLSSAESRGKNIAYITQLGTHNGPLGGLDSVYEYATQDIEFANMLKERLRPIHSIPPLSLPKDKITVALHVRKGGGYDPGLLSRQIFDANQEPDCPTVRRPHFADQRYPAKFPPDQFYIDQLLLLSELVDNAPLYVYLFTDDPNPAALAKKYKDILQKPNITFDYRKEKNAHNLNVLDDYVHIAQFDCLIRGASNFSRCAQLIGNHTLVLHAQMAEWQGDRILVTKVGVVVRNNEKNITIIEKHRPHEKNIQQLKNDILQQVNQTGYNSIKDFIQGM